MKQTVILLSFLLGAASVQNANARVHHITPVLPAEPIVPVNPKISQTFCMSFGTNIGQQQANTQCTTDCQTTYLGNTGVAQCSTVKAARLCSQPKGSYPCICTCSGSVANQQDAQPHEH